MRAQFKSHLYQFITPNDKILLAVSGGVDSMVMAELFLNCHSNFSIAHCNFQLRGEASDKDEIFVKNWAAKNNVSFFTTKFDTISESKSQGKGIQEIARKLRYEWFESILIENDFDFIATAHHKNDSIETVLFNLSRGTGLKGLTGIQTKRDKLIRPLLFLNKEEILNLAVENKIEYREDQSNTSIKYKRNYIRNKVVPEFKKMNPSFESNMENNIQRFNNLNDLLSFFIEKTKTEISETKNGQLHIFKSKLETLPQPVTILFEILKNKNFNFDQCKNIVANLSRNPGNLFYSASHRLLIDRKFLIIEKLVDSKTIFLIISPEEQIQLPTGILSCSNESKIPDQIENSKLTACLDASKLKFPLTIENWKDGDRFAPIGMNGKTKKIKAYLTDEKLSRFEKENTLVLKSEGKICWVIGQRIDENFKINTKSKTCFIFEISE